MLLSTINGSQPQPLDLSVFINCHPDKTLSYFYNSEMRIRLSTWCEMKEWQQQNGSLDSCLHQWLRLLEDELGMGSDLLALKENDYLDHIGPYYYSSGNTRIYVEKCGDTEEMIPSSTFGHLNRLNQEPEIPKEMAKYNQPRKGARKTAAEPNNLLTDIRMCRQALEQSQRITEQIAFFHTLIAERQAILDDENLLPAEPDRCPQRPLQPEEPLPEPGVMSFAGNRARHKEYKELCNDYAHQLKTYLLRYREFEKSGERYKQLLVDWPHCHQQLRERCQQDISAAEEKLATALYILDLCRLTLERSSIHPDYHMPEILERFEHYLTTGRCDDLPSCMNIWEEETQWREIKASQERIENTIYFLQADLENSGAQASSLFEEAAAASELVLGRKLPLRLFAGR
ncbi:MAG: hypothetical protein Q4B48_07115 [Syntrophomonadaceae bacterium]|nr:hypothetical protein [Syntrophomonadaceae bacterium]